ncbi:uncharacterized protein LOC100899018 [Galendromus occidentalis]|uniref:Uncharacterized protein LOC100899018 n=1 Tax=Galendromus occidentalis TaxID=34638 RepID=A0AAJ6VUX1_9ACAR|nr:uncharacterized protein LOC100899018 [Galendromus occidentalis]
MGIFDLEDWRSLWNLNKPPKSFRSQYSNFSVNSTLNRSYGDLSTSQRRYMARKNNDEVDARSFLSLERQLSKASGKRGGSLPPPSGRRALSAANTRVHNANGMVEPTRQPENFRTAPTTNELPAKPPLNDSDSSPESKGSARVSRQNQPVLQRPTSKIALSGDSSWIKPRKDLDSSFELVDNDKNDLGAQRQNHLAKEPVKNWEKQLNRKSNENLGNRYGNAARSSARNLLADESDEQPTTFIEARRKFQQLAQASHERHAQAYSEPLRVKFNSQQNIPSGDRAQMKQYQSAAGLDVYDYPRKNADIQKRDSLYNRANSSGLPEPVRSSSSYDARPARVEPASLPAARRNIALLGLSSDKSETEVADAVVTSTPRSSTRKSKSRENLLDPDWDTLDIVLKRSKKRSEELGFVIRGGLGEEVRSGDAQIYVSQIIPGELAALDGKLRVGDIIVAVNGHDMRSMSHKAATRLLNLSGSMVRLTVKRFVGKIHIMQLVLEKNGQPLGLTVTGGVGNEVPGGGTAIYVKNINPNGVAYRVGGIEVGDQIQKVNNTVLTDASHHFATECLRNAEDPVALVIAKTGRINPMLFIEQ